MQPLLSCGREGVTRGQRGERGVGSTGGHNTWALDESLSTDAHLYTLLLLIMLQVRWGQADSTEPNNDPFAGKQQHIDAYLKGRTGEKQKHPPEQGLS